MPLDLSDDKSTLVQAMAWCRQATIHYLNQCWPRSMSPNGGTRPQRVYAFLIGYYLNICYFCVRVKCHWDSQLTYWIANLFKKWSWYNDVWNNCIIHKLPSVFLNMIHNAIFIQSTIQLAFSSSVEIISHSSHRILVKRESDLCIVNWSCVTIAYAITAHGYFVIELCNRHFPTVK